MVESGASPALMIERISLGLIYTSPHQMRRYFDPMALKDLASSMKQEGLIQPITVRKVGNAYELIVGERRLRAARMLKWTAIEARILDISDEDAAVKGLIENLQRVDLSPIEEARGYKQLAETPYKLTQDAIAQRVGKCQTAIARSLAILELPQEIQDLMPRGIITETHTRSLRKVPERSKQIALAKQGHREGWTAKEMERRVGDHLKSQGMETKPKETSGIAATPDPMMKVWDEVQKNASQAGIRVSVSQRKKSGAWSIEIHTEKSTLPRRALADFFMRLGHLLNGPLPQDLPVSRK